MRSRDDATRARKVKKGKCLGKCRSRFAASIIHYLSISSFKSTPCTLELPPTTSLFLQHSKYSPVSIFTIQFISLFTSRPAMPPSFFASFPREIRDQIYTHILESPVGSISLQPWTVEVARSLSVLRVCRQMHRECKDIIWLHKGLLLRQPTDIYKKLSHISTMRRNRMRSLAIDLEVLDRDELEWVASGLSYLHDFPRMEDITLQSAWESPRDLREFKAVMQLRNGKERLDGRLFRIARSTPFSVNYMTGWPPFSSWGKQRWAKRMLSDSVGLDKVLKVIHDMFGGELWVNGVLCFKDKRQVAPCNLDPGNGTIRIIPQSAITRPDIIYEMVEAR